MINIAVEFHRHGNVVCGRVLSMPEELRGHGSIMSENKYEIISANSPELRNTQLYLRGERTECDNMWFTYSYGSEKIAQNAIDKYEELIKTYNNLERRR